MVKFFLFLFIPTFYFASDLNLTAEKVVLINAENGRVLYEKNMHEADFPASIVKLATALYIVKEKEIPLDRIITAKKEALLSIKPDIKKESNYRSPAYWLETNGAHISIQPGEELSVEMLLHALLLCSANDAANVLAQDIGGTIAQFMRDLNAYVKSLGCHKTHFSNPHGLHHPKMVTTAYDMGLIAKEVLSEPVLLEICSKKNYTCPETNIKEARYFKQTNRLLLKGAYEYPKAIGLKTGTTSSAGKTLVAAAKDAHRAVVAVMLGFRDKKERYPEMIQLLDYAMKEERKTKVIFSKEHLFVSKIKHFQATLDEDCMYEYFPSEEENVTAKICWYHLKGSISKGTPVGELIVLSPKKEVLSKQSLIASKDLPSTLIQRGFEKLLEHKYLSISIAFLFCAFLYHKKRSYRRR